ncbi:acyltransferase [Clostridium culturomicium]|uniref:acyltransferase n=1 Tax=Clostridium culturomicium TaxID=1499683 RepID=UPI003857DBAB
MFELRRRLEILSALPKSIYFNFKVLPWKKAIRMPFLVYPNIKLRKLSKGVVKINSDLHPFMIKVGLVYNDDVPKINLGYISLASNSRIEFNGNAELSYGVIIKTCNNSKITFGKNFFCNKNCSFICSSKINIGNDVLMGWNINIRDNDGGNHKIFVEGNMKENKKPIYIGNHVWICSYSHILKGVTIADNCVVAYNSCITKSFIEKSNLIGGNPTRIIQEHIEWQR